MKKIYRNNMFFHEIKCQNEQVVYLMVSETRAHNNWVPKTCLLLCSKIKDIPSLSPVIILATLPFKPEQHCIVPLQAGFAKRVSVTNCRRLLLTNFIQLYKHMHIAEDAKYKLDHKPPTARVGISLERRVLIKWHGKIGSFRINPRGRPGAEPVINTEQLVTAACVFQRILTSLSAVVKVICERFTTSCSTGVLWRGNVIKIAI